MRRSYRRDGWKIEIGEHVHGGMWAQLTSPRGRRASYDFLFPQDGELVWDECPFPEFGSSHLRQSGHIRELTSWAVAQWCAAERVLEPDLVY